MRYLEAASSRTAVWDGAGRIVVLVLHDDAVRRQELVTQLMREGFGNIAEAEDAGQALEWMRANERPDIVVCDSDMAETDGLEFCNLVRRDDDANARAIPIILLVSSPLALVQEVGRQVGAAAVIVKPAQELSVVIRLAVGFAAREPGADIAALMDVDRQTAQFLRDLSHKHAPTALSSMGPNHPGAWSSAEEFSVFVIEPKHWMRHLILQILRQKGFTRTEEAPSGAAALSALQYGYLPDVVICNADPAADDWEIFCDGVRDMPFSALHKLPILLLSVEPTAALEELVKRTGTAKIVGWPVSAEILSRNIHEMVGYVAD